MRLDLEWMARDYETLLATVPTDRLDELTDGTRWTNRQLLWHMAFGQHIARVLLPLMGGFSRLPASASRRYSSILSAATRPYDWVNFAGSVAGSRVTGLGLARRWMRCDTQWLLGWGARATDGQLASGMSVPAEWDPYFSSWMNRYDLLVWAKNHYDHHRAQLTIHAADGPQPGPRD
ncbi:MAG: DinB family protein [Terracoccus sp.]